MKQFHIFNSDDKIENWGYGEWVEEPDIVVFRYQKITCIIVRHNCSGHLCGYAIVRSNHPYFNKSYSEMEIDVHGGITYGELHKHRFWIGFDCGHSGDYIPSLEFLYCKDPQLKALRQKHLAKIQEIQEEFNFHVSPIFTKTYKNIQFCIQECKSLAEQLNSLVKNAR